jgi:hypothetical protein
MNHGRKPKRRGEPRPHAARPAGFCNESSKSAQSSARTPRAREAVTDTIPCTHRTPVGSESIGIRPNDSYILLISKDSK